MTDLVLITTETVTAEVTGRVSKVLSVARLIILSPFTGVTAVEMPGSRVVARHADKAKAVARLTALLNAPGRLQGADAPLTPAFRSHAAVMSRKLLLNRLPSSRIYCYLVQDEYIFVVARYDAAGTACCAGSQIDGQKSGAGIVRGRV